jgi:hypothetical protein
MQVQKSSKIPYHVENLIGYHMPGESEGVN